MNIEVFADIWCPFAHVGLRAVAAERDRLGRDDVVLWVRAWPLELVNGVPMDGHHAAERATALRDQVAPDMFAGVVPDNFPSTTLPALALVSRAYATDPRLGERASFLVRDALFEHGQDISDPIVIQRLADELGIGLPDDADHQQVLADYAEGQQRGVKGSPHFFGPDGDVFCPALQISRDEHDEFVIAADRARLTEFVDRCLVG
ncbi:MAG: DsbA family protein [Actinomycetota bacterium]|nr:DsbA family protein [Actinomycetota bacterium]